MKNLIETQEIIQQKEIVLAKINKLEQDLETNAYYPISPIVIQFGKFCIAGLFFLTEILLIVFTAHSFVTLSKGQRKINEICSQVIGKICELDDLPAITVTEYDCGTGKHWVRNSIKYFSNCKDPLIPEILKQARNYGDQMTLPALAFIGTGTLLLVLTIILIAFMPLACIHNNSRIWDIFGFCNPFKVFLNSHTQNELKELVVEHIELQEIKNDASLSICKEAISEVKKNCQQEIFSKRLMIYKNSSKNLAFFSFTNNFVYDEKTPLLGLRSKK